MEHMIEKVLEEVRPYSMVHPSNLRATIEFALQAIDKELPGDFVECGTWMGGASFAMLLAQRYRYGRIIRPVWMLDSFEGLPAVDSRDGPMAAAYQRDTDAPGYMNNCLAPLDKVRAAVEHFAFSPEEAIIVPGWFDQTIPARKAELVQRGIAFLRIDCDWYEPVSLVLRELTPLVPEEGHILIDDYYAWDGCARATHDYLSSNNHCWRIRTLPDLTGAFLIKRAFRSGDL